MTKKDNLIPLDTIPPGSKITIEIDTDLYIRIQQILMEALPYKDVEHFQSVLKLVYKDEAQKDPIAYHAHTILYLLSLIETAAKAQGVIVSKKFNPELQKIID